MLYISSEDYLNFYSEREIVSYTYVNYLFCSYMLATLDKPLIMVHPICGKIETYQILLSGRGFNCFKKIKSFPLEVLVFAPNYLETKNKKRCKNVLAIANVYQK